MQRLARPTRRQRFRDLLRYWNLQESLQSRLQQLCCAAPEMRFLRRSVGGTRSEQGRPWTTRTPGQRFLSAPNTRSRAKISKCNISPLIMGGTVGRIIFAPLSRYLFSFYAKVHYIIAAKIAPPSLGPGARQPRRRISRLSRRRPRRGRRRRRRHGRHLLYVGLTGEDLLLQALVVDPGGRVALAWFGHGKTLKGLRSEK